MKIASLKGGRDGTLVLVSGDLERMIDIPDIAPTLQAAFDDWAKVEPLMRERAAALEADASIGAPFDPAAAAAPLPRAYHWVDGSVYLNHMELVRTARGADMPDSVRHSPLV